jgi:hypothetical protein
MYTVVWIEEEQIVTEDDPKQANPPRWGQVRIDQAGLPLDATLTA